jgi:hypothetical protein
VNRALILIGVLLAVFGVLVLAGAIGSGSLPADRVPLIGETQGQIEAPSRLLSIGAGLSLAAGAACIGLGVNRWGWRRGQRAKGKGQR